MNVLKYILLGLQYLPAILQAVIAVENVSLNPTNGVKLTGPNKKALVLNSAATPAPDGSITPADHIDVISKQIDQIVSTLNNSGVFTHK